MLTTELYSLNLTALAHEITGRIVTAAEVASVVTFLASPKSVAVNGEVVCCTSGPGAIHY